MSKNTNDVNDNSLRQNTDTNFNNKKEVYVAEKKRPKIKIDKQVKRESFQMRRLKNGENQNEFVIGEDEKKNEEIVLKAIQERWYTEFNRLIYSRNYSYLYLVSAACFFILFIFSLVFYKYDITSLIVIPVVVFFLIFVCFTFFDIAIRNYIMVILF